MSFRFAMAANTSFAAAVKEWQRHISSAVLCSQCYDILDHGKGPSTMRNQYAALAVIDDQNNSEVVTLCVPLKCFVGRQKPAVITYRGEKVRDLHGFISQECVVLLTLLLIDRSTA